MLRPRTFALCACALAGLLATAAPAVELPPAPDGFAWRRVEGLQASFLVPEGWHFRSTHEGHSAEILITEKEVSESGTYDTGVSVEVFLEDPNAPLKLRRVMDEAASRHEAEVAASTTGPFVMLTTEFQTARPGNPEPYRVFSVGIANTETNTTYLVTFGTPSARWTETWPKGQTIVSTLALDAEL